MQISKYLNKIYIILDELSCKDSTRSGSVSERGKLRSVKSV